MVKLFDTMKTTRQNNIREEIDPFMIVEWIYFIADKICGDWGISILMNV